MIKTLFLLGALLALPLRAAMLPLSAETQAYADTLTELTFCYPVLQRPPYLEEQGGVAHRSDETTGPATAGAAALRKLPNWTATLQGLQHGQCDLIPHVGPARETLPGTALSRAMLEAESAILYRGGARAGDLPGLAHLAGRGDPAAALSPLFPVAPDGCGELVWGSGGGQRQRLPRRLSATALSDAGVPG